MCHTEQFLYRSVKPRVLSPRAKRDQVFSTIDVALLLFIDGTDVVEIIDHTSTLALAGLIEPTELLCRDHQLS